MKTTILLLLISTLSIGQSYNWDSIALETQKKLDRNESIVDSISRMEVLNAIKFKENLNIKRCEEMGHIIMLTYCIPYLIDTDTTTIRVYPVFNWAGDFMLKDFGGMDYEIARGCAISCTFVYD